MPTIPSPVKITTGISEEVSSDTSNSEKIKKRKKAVKLLNAYSNQYKGLSSPVRRKAEIGSPLPKLKKELKSPEK